MGTPVGVRAIAFCSIALFASLAASAGEATPEELLRRMGLALRTIDFEGSFVYTHDGRTDALRIFHLGGTEERERLVSLTGARSEIVRNGRMITCLTPGAAPTEFANRQGASLLPLVPNVRELGEQYSVSAAGSDRVAGYEARVLELSPRDPYRYGYRLWLEEGNHLLLRSAVLDAAKRPLEQFMFVALDIGSKPSETELAPAGDVGNASVPADEVATTAKPLWRIAEAPAGFRLVRTQRPVEGDPKAEHLVYSDGIASVSIYIEPHADTTQAATESTIVRGVLSIHSRDAGGLRITALGDVPPVTVQAMARGVRSIAAR
ncbi:MAG TPA: MucB/RseB C-terminal domain-containing protein [Rhodanobacteraceae bacterium]|nr:MucB/RseB C-terminal domain-containing protein [Rhodanobacteraceae bacterium]